MKIDKSKIEIKMKIMNDICKELKSAYEYLDYNIVCDFQNKSEYGNLSISNKIILTKEESIAEGFATKKVTSKKYREVSNFDLYDNDTEFCCDLYGSNNISLHVCVDTREICYQDIIELLATYLISFDDTTNAILETFEEYRM